MRGNLDTTIEMNRKGYKETIEKCAKIARNNHLNKLSFDMDLEASDVMTRPAITVTIETLKGRLEMYINRALDLDNLDAAIQIEEILLAVC